MSEYIREGIWRGEPPSRYLSKKLRRKKKADQPLKIIQVSFGACVKGILSLNNQSDLNESTLFQMSFGGCVICSINAPSLKK
jgi:hypothetical protein